VSHYLADQVQCLRFLVIRDKSVDPWCRDMGSLGNEGSIRVISNMDQCAFIASPSESSSSGLPAFLASCVTALKSQSLFGNHGGNGDRISDYCASQH
jgi:hypothetical protein